MNPEIAQLLTRAYSDPKQGPSFSSARKLYTFLKEKGHNITHTQTREWLSKVRVHQLYKQPFKGKRSRIYAKGLFTSLQADLADVPQLSRENKGTKYWLVVVDVFSRYFFVRPLKNKTGLEVSRAMDSVLDEIPPNVIETISTDAGLEFLAKDTQNVFNQRSIKHFIMRNEKKCALAERAIKTLKVKVSKYLHHNDSRKYIDSLQDIVTGINNRVNRSTGYTPEAIKSNEAAHDDVRKRLFPSRKGIYRFKFDLGDQVRLLTAKTKFSRATDPTFTEEIFIISNRIPTIPPRYIITGLDGSEIIGTWYDFELQKNETTQ